jgi:hypothetical protein
MPEPLRILAGEDRPSTVVGPKPRATGLSLDEIVADHLDYLHHEAFFVVSTTFEVTAYRTLWFGLQYDSATVEQGETVGNGALATVRWYDGEPVGDGHLQGQFAALKDVVSTDHCGYTREQKQVYPWWEGTFGMNSIQQRLPVFHDEAVAERDFGYPFSVLHKAG